MCTANIDREPGGVVGLKDNPLLAGEQLVRQYHSFNCHGPLGQGGFKNPGSRGRATFGPAAGIGVNHRLNLKLIEVADEPHFKAMNKAIKKGWGALSYRRRGLQSIVKNSNI